MAPFSIEGASSKSGAVHIALAGRFAQPPRHGDADRVMPVHLAENAQGQLHALGGRVTFDRFPGLGHGIDGRVLSAVVGHMRDAHFPPF